MVVGRRRCSRRPLCPRHHFFYLDLGHRHSRVCQGGQTWEAVGWPGSLGGWRGWVPLWSSLTQLGPRLPRASLGWQQRAEQRGRWSRTERRPEQTRSSGVKILPRVLWAPCFAKGRNRQALAGISRAALPRSCISPGGAGRSESGGKRGRAPSSRKRAGGEKLLACAGPAGRIRSRYPSRLS